MQIKVIKKISFVILFISSAGLFRDAGAQETGSIHNTVKSSDKNDAEKICSIALRNFERQFKHVDDAVWSKTSEGAFIVNFVKDSMSTMVAYNKKGIWHHTIKSYNEKLLPHHLRTQIKNDYRNYTVNWAQEINLDAQTVYFIYLGSKEDFKIIKIGDDEIEEMESIKPN